MLPFAIHRNNTRYKNIFVDLPTLSVHLCMKIFVLYLRHLFLWRVDISGKTPQKKVGLVLTDGSSEEHIIQALKEDQGKLDRLLDRHQVSLTFGPGDVGAEHGGHILSRHVVDVRFAHHLL